MQIEADQFDKNFGWDFVGLKNSEYFDSEFDFQEDFAEKQQKKV